MVLDKEKDVEELVSNIKVGDIVCLKDKTCYRVTNLTFLDKEVVTVGLNGLSHTVDYLKKVIYALYRIGDRNESYLFGDLDYSKEYDGVLA